MQIKRYQRDQIPSGASGLSHSLSGERRAAPTIPATRERVWQQAANLAETVTGIGAKMMEAQRLEQYNENVLAAKEKIVGYAAEMEDPAFLQTLTPEERRDLAKTYETKMRDRITTVSSDLSAQIDDPQALDAFNQKTRELSLEYTTRAKATGRRYHVEALRAKTAGQLDSLKNQFITGDLTAATDAKAIVDGMVATGAFSPEEGQRLNASWLDTAGTAYWERQIQNDPRGALKVLQDGESAAYLDEARRTRLIDAAQVEIRRLDRENKDRFRDRAAVIRQDLNDSLESILRTGQPMPGTKAMLQEMHAMGGDYAKDAEAIGRKVDQTFQAWTVYEDVKTQPFDEQQKIIDEKLKPPPGAHGYELKAEVYDFVSRMIARERQVFDDDPAAYVAEEAARRLASAGRDPERDMSAWASARLNIQSRYGLAPNDRRILTKPEAAQFRGRYAQANPGEQAAMVADLSRFGPYQKQALKELELGYAHTFAATQRVDQAERIIQALGTDEKNIGLDPEQKKDIKKESQAAFYSDDAMGGVLSKIAHLTGNPEYTTMAGSLSEVTTKMSLVAGDAERGGKETWSGYHFINEDDLCYAWIPDTYNPQDVRRALSRWRSRNVEDIVRHKKKQFASPDYFDEYVRDLKSGGVFIPAGDSEGFNLVDPATGKTVTGRDGNAIKITFADLGADIERVRKEKLKILDESVRLAMDPNLTGF